MPGWARLCTASKRWRQNCSGTSGRITPEEVSTSSCLPLINTVVTLSEGTCTARRQSGQAGCASAMSATSNGGPLSTPPPCLAAVPQKRREVAAPRLRPKRSEQLAGRQVEGAAPRRRPLRQRQPAGRSREKQLCLLLHQHMRRLPPPAARVCPPQC
jgi:hypothetical protein